METIKRGSINKPVENGGGDAKEAIIVRGVRTPGSSFDKRAGDSGGVGYIGASKICGRSSAISGGTGQKKKHKSTGKGQ